jgi:hypothetical protein
MRKFPSLKSATRQILRSIGYRRLSVLENRNPKAHIPGMIMSDEIAFFKESAARYGGREGAIVDLGCWLGSTSIALAQGILSHSPNGNNPQEKVLGFDIFVWEEWMPAHIPYCLYHSGDSFLPEARRLARDHGRDAVELIRADLALYEWTAGPIKILLVDAMKSEKLARQIARNFYPSLITGSLLIHQDFKHFYTSWIHILQYRLRQYFRLYRSVVGTGTAAFEVLAPIPREVVDRATDFTRIPEDQIEASFRYSLDLVGSDDYVNVAAAHVMQYVHLGRNNRASETLEMYRSLGISEEGEFLKMLSCLKQSDDRKQRTMC